MAGKNLDWRPGPSVCRCCFAEGCYKDISTEYFWMGKREVYSEMLNETFDVSIAYSQSGGPNSNSRLICEPCISRLRDASDFKRQVLECEKTFMHHLDPGSSSAMELEVEVEQMDKEVKLERVKLERKMSEDDFDDNVGFGDDDDDDDLDDQPLTKLATKVPKKESVDVLETLLDTAKAEKRKSTIKVKVTPAKKPKKKEIVVKASASKTAAKPEKKKKGSTELKIKWKPKRKFNDHRGNAAIVIECSNVCPFRWKRGAFVCAFCPQSFGDFTELKQHTLDHPNRIEVLRTARINDTIKVEVSELRCELCLASVDSIEYLKDHLLTQHDQPISKEHDIGVTPFIITANEFFCTHCNERFELFTKLNTHINQHYPNNICFQCGKSFSVAHRLHAHLNIHSESENNLFKCTKCSETFTSRVLRNKHINAVHKKHFKYRCPHCNDNFARYIERVKHLKEYHDRKVEYPCHLCSSVFALCNQRTKHIQQVHIKHKGYLCQMCPDKFVTAGQLKMHMVKHVGDRTFQCHVCKKAYARAKTLKEHMRIHDNDKRFVCEYCNYACVQKCSLKSHMKTHHPGAECLKIGLISEAD